MKERLTGAIILVALIVLLVPELLTGPVRSAPRGYAVASSAEEPPLRSYTINLADDAHTHSAPTQTNGPEQPAPLAAAAPSPVAAASAAAESHSAAHSPPRDSTPPPAPPQPVATPPASASAPGATAAPVASATSGSGQFMVQLGSFASHANADRLARQVRAQGFPVSVSQGSSGQHLYRVRVGPAHDHAAATQLAQQLRASGHTGSVVPK